MPVYSPLPLRAVLSGFRGLLSASYAARAREEVESWLKRGDPDREVLLLDSGTSALTLALKATATDANRPVAIPAFACYDIATAVDGARVPFVFYDVDPSTLGPDLASLRAALEAGADRIVVVHLYGIPVDLDAVGRLSAEFGATVIEDAAQGVGGAWRGTPLGLSGSLGVFSFGRGKGVTGGSGGALVANTDAGRLLLTQARASGLRASSSNIRGIPKQVAQWLLARRALYSIPASMPFLGLGETPFHPARQAAMASPQSVGVVKHTKDLAWRESEVRRLHASQLLRHVNRARWNPIKVVPDGVPGYLRLPLIARDAESRGRRSNARRLGIMPGYPGALSDLAGFGSKHAVPLPALVGARFLAQRLITMPVHSRLSEHDLIALEEWAAS